MPSRRGSAEVATVAVFGSLADSLVNFRGPLLRELSARGHRVVGLAPPGSPELERRLAALGARFLPVPLDRTGLNPWADLRTLVSLLRTFRRIDCDVLLAYTIKPSIYGTIAATLAGVPRRYTMVTGLGFAFGQSPGRSGVAALAARALWRVAAALSRRLFFQNPDDRELFLEQGILRDPRRGVLINGSGVDLDHYAASPATSDPRFLLMARLLKDKGILEYIEAARELKTGRHPSASFRLLGPRDPNPAALDFEIVEAAHRDGIIEYLGSTDDVRPALREANVFVLPSYREGTPRSVLEAMAIGRPIVTTDAPGCRQTVADGRNGFLVPPRDSGALARAMERFILEPWRIEPMGAESRRLVEETYDVRGVNRKLLAEMGL
jgi:glycosyltransferase involved in cell wall biosynthesis